MLKFIRPTTWEEVFDDWKQREGGDPGWIRCATVDKGWDSWESWRRFTAEQIGAATREWNLYEFTDPMQEIPEMLVGPFSGWQSRLPTPNKYTFADLVRIPEQAVHFQAHEKVVSMMKSFPPLTTFIGLQFPGNEKTIMSDVVSLRSTNIGCTRSEQLCPIGHNCSLASFADRTKLFQGKKVICIEGHHRATAVALAQLDGKDIDFSGSVQIALATLRSVELDLLDRVLARGTSR